MMLRHCDAVNGACETQCVSNCAEINVMLTAYLALQLILSSLFALNVISLTIYWVGMFHRFWLATKFPPFYKLKFLKRFNKITTN